MCPFVHDLQQNHTKRPESSGLHLFFHQATTNCGE
jgi:hypothetical protein